MDTFVSQRERERELWFLNKVFPLDLLYQFIVLTVEDPLYGL